MLMQSFAFVICVLLSSCSFFNEQNKQVSISETEHLCLERPGKWGDKIHEPEEGLNYRPGGASFVVNIHSSHLFCALCNYDVVMKTGTNWSLSNHPDENHQMKRMPEMTADNARDIVLKIIKENKDDCINDIYREWELSYTPLFIALQAGDEVLVEALIKKGAQTNPLSICNFCGDDDCIWQERIVQSTHPKVHAAYQRYLKLKADKK